MMRVQVLYFEGCPNHQPAVELVRSLAPHATIEEVEVRSPEDAERLQFLGSPTILVDGVDVEPGARSRTDFGFCCRTYNGRGLPSRELLHAALGSGGCCSPPPAPPPRSVWFSSGSVVTAVIASACCWLPPLLLVFGVSAASVSEWFARARPVFLGGSALLLAGGFYFAYHKESCCAPQARRLRRALLWVAAALVLGFAIYPYAARAFSSQPDVQGPAVTLPIQGMTCEACAARVQQALAEVPGVVAARIDYAEGRAIVAIDPSSPPDNLALVQAVKSAGYEVAK